MSLCNLLPPRRLKKLMSASLLRSCYYCREFSASALGQDKNSEKLTRSTIGQSNYKKANLLPFLNSYASFKSIVHKYGSTAIGLHVSVFATTFSVLYASLRFGLDGNYYLNIIKSYVPLLNNMDIHPEWGKLGLAYGTTAILGPIRYVITVVGTPPLYRFIYEKDPGP